MEERWRLDEQEPVDEQSQVEAGGGRRWMNSSPWMLEEEQRKQEAERLQGLQSVHAELALKFQRQQQEIESLSQERGSQQWQQLADPALDSTVASMPRSSVGSAPGEAQLLDRYLWMTSWRALIVSYTSK